MAGGDLLQEYAFPYELQDIHQEFEWATTWLWWNEV